MATARAKDIELPTQAPVAAAPGSADSAALPTADPFVPAIPVAETLVDGAPLPTGDPATDSGWGSDILLAVLMLLLVLLALAAARILRLTEALRTVHEDELAALGEAREMRRRLGLADARLTEETAARERVFEKRAKEMARERDELLRTNHLLQGMVRCDTVTGLANGPYLARQLAKELRRAMRSRRPLSLLLCDIDGFGAYNRTHGHERGDELLQQIGSLLAAQFQRGGDLAARLDGDRFAVIMPETARADVEQLSARLVESVRQAAIPHGGAPGVDHVAVSVGTACVTSNKLLHPHQLLAEANDALVAARQAAADAKKPARRTRRKKTAKSGAAGTRKPAPKTAATRKKTTRTAPAARKATAAPTRAAPTPAETSAPAAAQAPAGNASAARTPARKLSAAQAAAGGNHLAATAAEEAAGVSGPLLPERAAGQS
jgi:diguanylate cyclase (GGDEF)-like protein